MDRPAARIVLGGFLAALAPFSWSHDSSELSSFDWRAVLKESRSITEPQAGRARWITGVPPARNLTLLHYGDNQTLCEEDANFLYDLTTEDITLASRCHRISHDGTTWKWAVDTIAAFSSNVIPGKPSHLRPVAFHDELGCRRYGAAAEKLSASGVTLAAFCRHTTTPEGRPRVILEVALTLQP